MPEKPTYEELEQRVRELETAESAPGHTGMSELRAGEANARNALKPVLEPQGDWDELKLADLIDVPAMQSLMESFHRITGMGSAIVDDKGSVLVRVGRQDICTKFHRRHPETLRNCVESDTFLAHGAAQGTFKEYRCKNGIWDLASPIEVSGRRIGNIHLGQFIYDGEEPEVEWFRNRARRYGFDEKEYLAALGRVPRYNREKVYEVMDFYARLAGMILSLSFSSVSLARTITERKRAEKETESLRAQLHQARKMEAVSTLAEGIAHDFKNILSIIVGNTEMVMLEVPERSAAQDILKEVREAALRAGELVKRIMMLARQKEHTVSNINLTPIAKESLKMLRASIPTTVRIHKDIEERLPSVLAGVPQVKQIIMNLCTNAGQAMEAAGGTLTFTLDSVELDTRFVTVAGVLSPGQYLCMKVSDTGPGIPPGIVERIFDPFFTTKGVGEGTGMGLAVVHGIVQDRKGGIIVDSEEGRGTTFTIYLPASEGQSVEVKAEQETEVPRGTERILFVDDEPMLIKMGRQMLERLGYNVETRASGTDALECFRLDPHRFDLVITDMTMPGMRGDRLAEEILASRKDIPIILCTGYSTQTSKVKAEETGIRAFVMKPLTQHELANTVRRVLDEKPRK